MPAYLDTCILPATTFNTIPQFEEQIHDLTHEQLSEFGQLFIKHKLENVLCIGLLHRHFDLQDGQALLHCAQMTETEICSPCDATAVTLFPHSLLLNSDLNFQAYEHSAVPQLPDMTFDFLDAMRSIMLQYGLQRTVSIVASPGPGCREHPLLETIDPRSMQLLSTPMQYSVARTAGTAEVATNWSFAKGAEGTLRVYQVKRCVKNVAGVHEVKDLD